ncbi:hypothetical protein [Pelagibacterium montanilacus]|uniref:hypothetical protein n=1 Tax=Pelagibacterium montanilacus TaxID=2185280 RepID=UPI000F8E8DB3|nr:hypothetical protein [Pelagibacterium montanilacus]
MHRRKVIGSALFFSLFGMMASVPPLIMLFRFEGFVFGIPAATVFLFGLWVFLVVGAAWFSRALPRDEPASGVTKAP